MSTDRPQYGERAPRDQISGRLSQPEAPKPPRSTRDMVAGCGCLTLIALVALAAIVPAIVWLWQLVLG